MRSFKLRQCPRVRNLSIETGLALAVKNVTKDPLNRSIFMVTFSCVATSLELGRVTSILSDSERLQSLHNLNSEISLQVSSRVHVLSTKPKFQDSTEFQARLSVQQISAPKLIVLRKPVNNVTLNPEKGLNDRAARCSSLSVHGLQIHCMICGPIESEGPEV